MGYSKLATVQIWAAAECKYGARNHTIDSVAIHTMAGPMTVQSCGNWFSRPSTRAASNYGIDSSGTIAVYVDESEAPHCTSSEGVDRRAVSIEVASTTTTEPYTVTDEAYASLISLLVDICKRNNIASLKWKGDAAYGKAAAAGGSVAEQNMFVHRWFNLGKSCPGAWLFDRQGQIADEVNTRLGSSEYSVNSTTLSLNGMTVSMDYKEYNPYVVTLDRNTTDVDYDKLKSYKVMGALVEAGYHFDANNRPTSHFENPNLNTQIKELNERDIPFGLYTICRARNSAEAKEEMYRFSFPIRRHPPKLGAWLDLHISENEQYNTPILAQYRKELLRLGLRGRMGLICDREMLKHIEWDADSITTSSTTASQDYANFKNDYYLWLVDHIDNTDELDQLLDPTFFDTDGKG